MFLIKKVRPTSYTTYKFCFRKWFISQRFSDFNKANIKQGINTRTGKNVLASSTTLPNAQLNLNPYGIIGNVLPSFKHDGEFTFYLVRPDQLNVIQFSASLLPKHYSIWEEPWSGKCTLLSALCCAHLIKFKWYIHYCKNFNHVIKVSDRTSVNYGLLIKRPSFPL